MQVPSTTDPAMQSRTASSRMHFPISGDLALGAPCCRAHASLMRELATDLAMKVRLPLGDFDVLAQLAMAGGELRMTDLAAKAFSSRSAMTRRVDRLVEEGLVRRTDSAADGRGVVIALTEPGLTRLSQAVPVHLRGVSKLFLERLDEQELEALERVLDKVSVSCSFG